MDISKIEIRPVLPGFHQFISNWLIRDDVNILVDVGPANGGPGLLEDLRALDLDRLDYVLITHIHMDHCGALSQVLECYPDARVICHEKAVPHLQDPARLWEATQKILGKIGAAYGAPGPVPVEKLEPHPEASLKGLGVIETPGHAVHHLSFVYKGALFAGEAGGNYARVGNGEYLRPATPPKLFLDVFLKSVDRLLRWMTCPYITAISEPATAHGDCLGNFATRSNCGGARSRHRWPKPGTTWWNGASTSWWKRIPD